MKAGAIRRAQLISPFGVGAMSILVDGTSVVTAGLDHWYDQQPDDELVIEEYEEHDWRLEARLQVSGFRLPPDYRYKSQGDDKRNLRITVPVLRFPLWSFCTFCKRLEPSTSTLTSTPECRDPKHNKQKHKPRLVQVPFVAICSNGHLGDFPFREWVHKSSHPDCAGVLRLKSFGGSGLEGQRVECDLCGRKRSLRGITEARIKDGQEHTNLTDQLEGSGEPYLCSGARPWLGQGESRCNHPLQGALRAAGNVYFPKVESSIYLPPESGGTSADMRQLMKYPRVSSAMTALYGALQNSATAEQVRGAVAAVQSSELFEQISDEEILSAYHEKFLPRDVGELSATEDATDFPGAIDGWRHEEFLQIREDPKEEYLSASDPGIHRDLTSLLDRVRALETLRETRALRGFTRVRDSQLGLSEGKDLLRRQFRGPEEDWLPAYVVKGEGIYLELNKERLNQWEHRSEVQERASRISDHYSRAASLRGMEQRTLTPRFVLLHTLSHLLINELVFTCGYSSASLRERLYVSTKPDTTMGGILIYTAAGDSEGTMGGLVRMAKPERIRNSIGAAINGARWCSSDPVCMEAGEHGQGPDSCNLAACHGCALLPETSCEEFNRFLDRGLVVGTLDNPSLGFFSNLT